MGLEEKIQSRRHKELLDAVGTNKPHADKSGEIIAALKTLGDKIELFIKAVKDAPPPQINVNANQDKVVNSVSEMELRIMKAFQELSSSLQREEKEPEVKQWVHKITKRDRAGKAEEIISTEKIK